MPEFVVHINHRKLLESLALYAGVDADRAGGVFRAIDKLAKIGATGVVEELVRAGVDRPAAGRVVELVATSGLPDVVMTAVSERLSGFEPARQALDDLEKLFSYLAALGAPSKHYELDLALARGLDYYTGPVFETTVEEPNVGSIGGAGRYDGLVGMFSGQEIPATGMSLGLERIIDVAEELNLLELRATIADVLVTIFDAPGTADSLALATEMRRAGLRTETFLEEGRDLGRQLRFAERRQIPFAVVLGPDERERGVVTVRDMRSREQVTVPRGDVAMHIHTALQRC
jgi:histidyl-tRNA synthetase